MLKVINPSHIFSLLLVTLTACGSIRDRNQYVSVDSAPRGAAVLDHSGNALGFTPIFYRVESQSDFILKLATDQGQFLHTVDCKFKWLRATLENLPLPLIFSSAGLPIAIGVYSAALITDIFTGAAFYCPDQITVTVPSVHKIYQESCPRYLSVGLDSLSQGAREEIINQWWVKRSRGSADKRSTSSCDLTILSDKDSWSHRLDLNVSDLNEGRLQEWRSEIPKVNRLGYETKASHILHLSQVKVSDSTRRLIKLTEVDLHTLKSQESIISAPPTAKSEMSGISHDLRSLFHQSSSLIPDTLGVSFLLRSIEGLGSDKQIYTVEQSSRSFAFTHISHPNVFASWDYDFNTNVGAGLDLSQGLTLDDQDKTRISFQRYTTELLFSLTGHTPLGAIGVGLGPSLALYRLSDPRLDGESHFAGEFNVGLHYTFFITERFMGRLKINHIQVGGSIGEKIFPNISDVAFTIGYYVPTLQRLPNELLDDD